MNTDTPKNTGAISPRKQSLDGTKEEEMEASEDNLFHAYAIKVGHHDTGCMNSTRAFEADDR